MSSSFLSELRAQLRRAHDQLHDAARAGDDYLSDAMQERVEQLRRIAMDHGVVVAFENTLGSGGSIRLC